MKNGIMKTTGCVCTFVFGVLLPLAALVVGLSLEGEDTFIAGIMPTPFHVALVASVPVANLVAWTCLLRGRGAQSRLVSALCGFSVGICAVYAVELVPLMFLGLVFCALGFWYFGLGFLGLLPCAPATGFVSALVFRHKLASVSKEAGVEQVGGFLAGLLAAALVWTVLGGSAIAAYCGCRRGLSDDPAVAAKGIQLARSLGREDVVRRYCRTGSFIDTTHWGRWEWWTGDDSTPEQRDLLYYRITGENPVYLHSWRSRRGMLSWDYFVGGEKVGGIVEGLSLKDSAYDTTVDAASGVGYCEWTVTFANSRTWGEAEARCRIALPPGGVVSRLTLWVNGEESEAAFGTKGQVRRAYESVVRRRRDPVLVNVCGPDQVQLQCFPVPHEGEMKVRLGVTVPLQVAADGKSARFPAPAIATRNFSVPADIIGLPAAETVVLDAPPAAFASFSDESREELAGSAILQKASSAPGWRPERVAFVIDTSAAMKPHIGKVFSALVGRVPGDIKREYWFLDDMPRDKPLPFIPKIRPACAGGRPALHTLVKALDSLSSQPGPSALVWIHAGEPLASQNGDAFALKLRKSPETRLFLCQVDVGDCPVAESMSPSPQIASLTAEALLGGIDHALEWLLAGWGGSNSWNAVRMKVPLAEVPAEAAKASDHLGRLWAAEETARVFRTGDPVALEKAQKTALPWHIVTAATGAVVLETQEQFKENGLEQVSPSSVPTTPEPSSILSLAVVALVFASVLFLRRRRAAA